MPDKSNDFTVGSNKRDDAVDPLSEMRDTVFEVVVSNLRDVRLVLNDNDFGRLRLRDAATILVVLVFLSDSSSDERVHPPGSQLPILIGLSELESAIQTRCGASLTERRFIVHRCNRVLQGVVRKETGGLGIGEEAET
jgi:hypothetical protein